MERPGGSLLPSGEGRGVGVGAGGWNGGGAMQEAVTHGTWQAVLQHGGPGLRGQRGLGGPPWVHLPGRRRDLGPTVRGGARGQALWAPPGGSLWPAE